MESHAAVPRTLPALEFDLEKQTLIFDRGNNSKTNLALLKELRLHYVGALTPYHHQALIKEARGNYRSVMVNGEPLDVYRAKKRIWGAERTVLVFVSERLKAGQLRGIHQALSRKEKKLRAIQHALLTPRGARSNKEDLARRIAAVTKGQFLKGLIKWSLIESGGGTLELEFSLDRQRLEALDEELGFRILMTDRDDWSTAEIVTAFYSQALIEGAFKNIKKPYHLALTPQHHWTDQKIHVHHFMCVLGYLLSSLLWKEARAKGGFSGTLDSLLDTLNNIRLAALIEPRTGPGRLKTTLINSRKCPRRSAGWSRRWPSASAT